MFCAPMEVERKIIRCNDKRPGDAIEVADVLQWSISETCVNTKKCVPLWATQGIRYQRRDIAWSEFSISRGKLADPEIAKSLLEVDAQSLQDRYGSSGRRPEEQILLQHIDEDSLSGRQTQVEAIRTKCQEFELLSFNNATLREEQERELSPENEQEREVERPLPLAPHQHSVHQDVWHFAQQGILNRNSDAFQPAFELFDKTSASKCLDLKKWPVQFLITADFARTVQATGDQDLDAFLRPVHWIASRNGGSTSENVVLSPYEAHELLPSIRQHKMITLHTYSPRVNMSGRTFEDLSFCAIPAAPKYRPHDAFIMQLNIFADQLYLRSYEQYLSVCRFFEICFRPPSEQIQIAYDGFVDPASRPAYDSTMEKECPFTISPIGFLRMLMAMRRKTQDFQKSHVGRILHGELLLEEHFQG